MVWFTNIVFMSFFVSQNQHRPRPANSRTEPGPRPTHPWAIASTASSNRYKGGSQSCRRNRDLGEGDICDLEVFYQSWIDLKMNFKWWLNLLIMVIDHGYWSIDYQYDINMSWFVMIFLSCKSDFPCTKTIRSSSVSQRVARATIVFCNLAQLRFCSHSSAPHTVETQIGPYVFYAWLQLRIPGWCKIRNTITVKQIQANPLREDRVAVQHEVTPLEAPHATATSAATLVRPIFLTPTAAESAEAAANMLKMSILRQQGNWATGKPVASFASANRAWSKGFCVHFSTVYEKEDHVENIGKPSLP